MISVQDLNAREIAAYALPSFDEMTEHAKTICFYNESFVDFLARFYSLKGKAILDYGCGCGAFSLMFTGHSDNVSACDLSPHNLAFTAQLTQGAAITFQDDFFASEVKRDTYDFIFCRGLGPLHLIPFTPESGAYVRRIVSALKHDGVAYFTLLGGSTGKRADKNGFLNHTLQDIYHFFGGIGHVAMVNALQQRAIVVTRDASAAAHVRSKMHSAVSNAIRTLNNWDEVAYLKYRVWLLTNEGAENCERSSSFSVAEQLVQSSFEDMRIPELAIQPVTLGAPSDSYPVYMVSGDSDRLAEMQLAASLAFFRRTSRNPLSSSLSRLRRAIKGLR